jgi:hypothetical protein
VSVRFQELELGVSITNFICIVCRMKGGIVLHWALIELRARKNAFGAVANFRYIHMSLFGT